MSLINQMLRDLENRKAKQAGYSGGKLPGVVPIYKREDLAFPWSIRLGGIVIAAVLLGMGLQYGMNRWHHPKQQALKSVYSQIPSIPSGWAGETQGSLTALTQEIKRLREETEAQNHLTLTKWDVQKYKETLRSDDTEKPSLKKATEPRLIKTEVLASPKEVADKAYRAIIPYIDQNRPAVALSKLQALLKKYPQCLSARMALAQLLQRQNKIAEAIQELKSGLSYTPESPDYIELLATLLTEEGKFAEALQVLNQMQPFIDENPSYYALMAGLYEHLEQYSIAISIYKQLLRFNPNSSVWWLGLGISLERSGDRKEAIHAYNQAREAEDLKPALRSYVESRLNVMERQA